ncbi:hypothetical protein TBR22_A51540 [Luteitalea sp. TBR-22]|uniref:CHAT domain-containing protein n=1 Tax=Luteitalea sp. TBR-22 TaxID=2802971 RepID=UPI001AF8AF90|nr:CHAT domain-containing protein [Luteitalea sp. TBR-22]BCS35919.1 hypothetical protein TBR22_A51540 [Luteitalea sp. TBR-22]
MTAPVRFTVVLGAADPAGPGTPAAWSSEVRDATGAVLAGSARRLQALPLDDQDDVLLTFPACHAPLADGAADADVLHALDARTLGRWYANMAGGQASDGMARRFGRYLFELVLGQPVWDAMLAAAAAAPIDLRIACPPEAWALMRLPWELMHDGQHFLAARPGPLVLMSRVVTAPGATATPRVFSPRVLFVVGSLQDDAEVRAGAEYLGLLRRLQALDLTLDSRVLRDATAETLQAEIARFQPSVVHFICHGGFIEGRGALRLLASDPGLPYVDYTAPQLLALLATTDEAGTTRYPPVVVLNACYSATPPVPGDDPVDRLSAAPVFGTGSAVLPTHADTIPLGAELVRGDGINGGPALVVGMGGKVADLACRLFTRQFYQSLLRGNPTWSAAAGRRGAFTHGFDPLDSVDWAMPVVFVEASAELAVDPAELDMARRRETAARQFRRQSDPPAFCGRFAFFDQWRQLTSPASTPARRLLAISMSAFDADRQLGGTRLLEELAVSAVHAGHVPILRTYNSKSGSPERPTDVPAIARELLAAALQTRLNYGLGALTTVPQVLALVQRQQGDATAPLDPAVSTAWLLDQTEAWRLAIQKDLWHVRDEIVAHLGVPAQGSGTPLAVVLLDEVQRYADAAGRFVADLLRAGGLGTPQDPIPVAFTYRKDPNYAGPFEQLRTALDAVSNWAFREELHPLREALTDRSIYLHLLLQRTPPLVPARAVPPQELDEWFALIHEATADGYPSHLKSTAGQLRIALRACRQASVIVEADDEQVLQALEP